MFKAAPDNIFFSACKKEELITDPVMAETLAIRWCLNLAKERALQDIIIQSDALAVVECFRGSNSLACIALIILDCKVLMNELNSVSVNHVSRDLYALAHIPWFYMFLQQYQVFGCLLINLNIDVQALIFINSQRKKINAIL